MNAMNIVRLGAVLSLAFLSCAVAPPSLAQSAPGLSGIDPILIEDLVAANRILANEKVLDGFGHVSVRDPRDPKRYLISRSVAPALEAEATDQNMRGAYERPWQLWKREAMKK